MSEKDKILETLNAYGNAIRNKDGASLAGFYTSDAIGFDLAPPLTQDASILRDPKAYDLWFESWDGAILSEPHAMRMEIATGLAAVYGLIQLTGTKKSGDKVDLWFRATTLLKKEAGAWKIFHIHNSVPFAMDGSEKALLSLKPEESLALS